MQTLARQTVQRPAQGAIARSGARRAARSAVVPHGVKDVFMPALSSTMTEVGADQN
jgi:hypothetical protein